MLTSEFVPKNLTQRIENKTQKSKTINMKKQLEMVRLTNLLNSTEELCSITNNQDVITDLVLMICGKKN